MVDVTVSGAQLRLRNARHVVRAVACAIDGRCVVGQVGALLVQ